MTYEHGADRNHRVIKQPRLIALPPQEMPLIKSQAERTLRDFWEEDAFHASVTIRRVFGQEFSDLELKILHDLWSHRKAIAKDPERYSRTLHCILNPETLSFWGRESVYKPIQTDVPVAFSLESGDLETDIRQITDPYYQRLRHHPFEVPKMVGIPESIRTTDMLNQMGLTTSESEGEGISISNALRNDSINYVLLQRYYMVLRKRVRTGVMVTDL